MKELLEQLWNVPADTLVETCYHFILVWGSILLAFFIIVFILGLVSWYRNK